MIFIVSDSTDCYYNLAAEEYFLHNKSDEVFMLWQNDNTIVVGKNQNTISEINPEFVNEKGINVVRRITGGGAVYHDLGNLNFSYITNTEGEWKMDFETFTVPVINALNKLGVNAECTGRNDITVSGKKISGNAQTVLKNRVLHHGTLLFASNMKVLSGALCPNNEKIRSKGIKSVAARVANITEFLDRDIEVAELIDKIRHEVFLTVNNVKEYRLTDKDDFEIKQLADNKYRTWEWNYGYSPKYDFHQKRYFEGGTIEAYLDVLDGVIKDAKLYGDFFGVCDVSDLEAALIGVRHTHDDMLAVLSRYKTDKYFAGLSLSDIMTALL